MQRIMPGMMSSVRAEGSDLGRRSAMTRRAGGAFQRALRAHGRVPRQGAAAARVATALMGQAFRWKTDYVKLSGMKNYRGNNGREIAFERVFQLCATMARKFLANQVPSRWEGTRGTPGVNRRLLRRSCSRSAGIHVCMNSFARASITISRDSLMKNEGPWVTHLTHLRATFAQAIKVNLWFP